MKRKKPSKPKPAKNQSGRKLIGLINLPTATLGELLDFCEKVTGKPVTGAELVDLRKLLAEFQPKKGGKR